VCVLNRMVQYCQTRMVLYCQTRFDVSFGALADATRRGVLEQLGRADASITAAWSLTCSGGFPRSFAIKSTGR
jgi:hypothetical protein